MRSFVQIEATSEPLGGRESERQGTLFHPLLAKQRALGNYALQELARSAGRTIGHEERARVERQQHVDLSGAQLHDDTGAHAAACAIGAHAFTLGEHIFLGPTVGFTGPSRRDVLSHELAHIAQVRHGRKTARRSSTVDIEREAHRVVSGERGGIQHGADAGQVYGFWPLLFAAGAGLYVLLRPNYANAPTSPETKTYKSVSEAQVAGEAIMIFGPGAFGAGTAGAGMGLSRFLAMNAAVGSAGSMGFQAVQDIGQGELAGAGTYASLGVGGGLLGMAGAGPMRAFAGGMRGIPLFATFGGSGATMGLTTLGMQDARRGEVSSFGDYATWGAGGMGLGFAGAGMAHGLDFAATQGIVRSDVLLSQQIAKASPAGAETIEQILARRPDVLGRMSEGYLKSRNFVVVYRGQAAPTDRILSPLVREGGVEASEAMLKKLREAGLTEAEIAGYTAKWNAEPVPSFDAPPGLGGQPLGGVGIPSSNIPGVAANFAKGGKGVVYVIRVPRSALPIDASKTGWGAKSLVEREKVFLNQIDPKFIAGARSPAGVTPLEAGFEGGEDVLVVVVQQ